MGSSPIDYTREVKYRKGRPVALPASQNKGEYIMMEVLDILLPMGILILCVYLIGYMSGSEQAREIYNPVIRKNDVK